MNTIEVTIGLDRKLKGSLPENHDELTSDQFMDVAKIFTKGEFNFIDKILLLHKWLAWSVSDFKEVFEVDPVLASDSDNNLCSKWSAMERNREAVKLLDFIFEDLILQRNYIPQIETSIRTWTKSIYIGYADRFRNVSFGEFIFADTYFILYQQTKNKTFLYKFIATLYRTRGKGFAREDWKGDYRKKFNEFNIDLDAQFLPCLDEDLLNAILYNYIGIRRWMGTKFPLVLPNDPGEKDAKKKKTRPQWQKLIRHFTGGDVTKENEIVVLPVSKIMAELNERIKENRKK